MSKLSDLIRYKEGHVKKLRREWHEAEGDDQKQAILADLRDKEEEELRDLIFQLEEQGEELHSDQIEMDAGLADYLVQTLTEIKDQFDRELERTDLYPNMRDWAFKKKRAFEDVIWFLRGGAHDYRGELKPIPPFLVFAEFPDGSVELFEEDSEADADVRIERLVDEDGAITTRYKAVPETGTKRLVYRPITERDNVYKELPPGILRRVVEGAGGPENLRWPEENEEPVDRKKRVRVGA